MSLSLFWVMKLLCALTCCRQFICFPVTVILPKTSASFRISDPNLACQHSVQYCALLRFGAAVKLMSFGFHTCLHWPPLLNMLHISFRMFALSGATLRCSPCADLSCMLSHRPLLCLLARSSPVCKPLAPRCLSCGLPCAGSGARSTRDCELESCPKPSARSLHAYTNEHSTLL